MFKHLPLTDSQTSIWDAQRLFVDGSLCNLSGYIEINGPVDMDRFKEAVDLACADAETFHLRFVDTPEGPRQYVDRDLRWPLTISDLSSESDPEHSARALMLEDTTRACAPQRDPLYSVALLRLGSSHFYCYLRCHQLIADSLALKVFLQSVLALYSHPRKYGPEERHTFGSWTNLRSKHENGEKDPLYQTARSFWESWLRTKPESVTLSGKLPTVAACRRPITLSRTLGLDLATNLRACAEANGTGLRELILSYVAHYLYKYTGETDLAIAVPADDRLTGEAPRPLAPLSHVIPLRILVEPNQTFAGLIAQTARRLTEAAPHQGFVVDMTGLCGTQVTVNTAQFYPELAGIQTRWRPIGDAPTFDLSVSLTNTHGSSDLLLTLHANPAHYTLPSLELHAQRLINLFSKNDEPLVNTPLSQIGLLSDSERANVINDWNNTSREYPTDKCIHELFEAQAALRPQAIAVASQGRSLTYAELNAQANQLARYLRRYGVGPDTVVAICVERGIDMILGLLAILKAGGAYVPLDPSFPSDRLTYMLKDSAPAALICHAATAQHLATLASDTPQINLSDDSAPWSSLSMDNLTRSETGAAPSNLVYVIYTSGSTGQPKGVGIHGMSLLNYSSFILGQLPKSPGLKFASVSTIAADLGNTVVFPSLIGGGELHVIGLDTATNAKLYEKYMSEHDIDVLKITPSHFKALFDAKRTAIVVPRRALIFGGERLTSELVDSIAELRPQCSIYNHYGPTECTVGSIMSLIKSDREQYANIPLGYPIANSRIYVLDGDDKPVPIGAVGEIYIAGAGVARGYRNREQETSKRFKLDPFSKDPADRMYMTGDLGRWLPNGMIEFIGRNDFQVKIRGFRIELGEIESAICQYPEIREAAVVAKEGTTGKRLIAYYTGRKGITVKDLRSHLLTTLPDYMVPASFMRLEAMPLTPNGKLDRRALPEPAHENDEKPVSAARSETEKALVEGWKRVLDSFNSDTSQSFVTIGGDSLSYIGVSMVVERVLGWMPKNWDELTIKQLALLKKDSRQSTSTINSTVLVRAISIVLVVLDHLHAASISGTTSALFLVSGWSFGRYQINSMYQNEGVKPLLTTIFRISLPVVLFTLFLQITVSSIHPESLLLYDNFIDPNFDRGLTFWFIEVLVQMLLAMAGLFSIRRIRTYAFRNPFTFGAVGALAWVALGVLISRVWDADYLYNRVPHTKMWLFFLGIAIASMGTRRHKILLISACTLFFAYNLYAHVTLFSLTPFSLLAAVFVTLVARVRIPARLTPVINKIAGASLFIYMTHFQFARVVEKSRLPANAWLSSAVALAGAVVLSHMWDFIYHGVVGYCQRVAVWIRSKGVAST